MSAVRSLVPVIRSSLLEKLKRLIASSIIAKISPAQHEVQAGYDDDILAAIASSPSVSYEASSRATESLWVESTEDGSFHVEVNIDYTGRWDGGEKEVRQIMASTVDSPVYYLTEKDKLLLETDPVGFIQADSQPESTDLIGFEPEESHGGGFADRVIALVVNSRPQREEDVRYIAVIPNLVQLQRQLQALKVIEAADDTSPIAPLRTLVGLNDGSSLPSNNASSQATLEQLPGERFDESQRSCISKAMNTPHFAVIQGPPGSGKTSVITSIVKRSVSHGQRVLIVSPTHVAVDNVVEKLTPLPHAEGNDEVQTASDELWPHTLAVRFATKPTKLSSHAKGYWVGREKQLRGATIARRVEAALRKHIPFAAELFDRINESVAGQAPISSTLSLVEDIVCGTPIGILSHPGVRKADPGEFDLLIVDEVSKMTLPEFLAIAVKARRWVLVGDPEQLPPYNNAEENADTLNDPINPHVELVCSIGAILQLQYKDEVRRDLGFVVVTDRPEEISAAIQLHIRECGIAAAPNISILQDDTDAGVIVCTPADLEQARRRVDKWVSRPGMQTPWRFRQGGLLVQRGISIPEIISESELIDDRQRMASMMFEVMHNTYHSLTWSRRTNIKLRHSKNRNGLKRYLPSQAALEAFCPNLSRNVVLTDLAKWYAVNAISVYDWLTGIPTEHFDISPLLELKGLNPAVLCNAVRPFVGALTLQYRMGHASLSAVPRKLFYFNAALHDGPNVQKSGHPKVMLVQVDQIKGHEWKESNIPEIEEIEKAIHQIASMPDSQRQELCSLMIITPYSEQEALLQQRMDALASHPSLAKVNISVCTLDRCQGKEADYVLISLVKSRASTFMDNPKRWNVAITRARKAMVFVGNIEAYLKEAKDAKLKGRSVARVGGQIWGNDFKSDCPEMSILALLLSTYKASYSLQLQHSTKS